jgi:endonuclease/exonuclease/phosphatase family metal-dependent hydrolase
MKPVWENERVSIRRLELPARAGLLICAVHLPSKLHWSDASQSFECFELARQIVAEEDRAGHRRSVLIGDFNMNPFEPGMIAANGLHAVMSRQVASRVTRTVQGREHRFLYNPMWNYLGDLRGTTAGSYFFDAAEHVNYFWNVFDQVLMRPELAERFDPSTLSILTSVGSRSLVRPDGRPDSRLYSDHLPIVFSLTF